MRKVLCSNSKFDRVFAHVLDDGTIDIMRQDQRFTIIGKDFTLLGTNPQGKGKTVLVIRDGKLVEDGIAFKKETPDGKDGNNGQEREQENGGNGNTDPAESGDDPDGAGSSSGGGTPQANPAGQLDNSEVEEGESELEHSDPAQVGAGEIPERKHTVKV